MMIYKLSSANSKKQRIRRGHLKSPIRLVPHANPLPDIRLVITDYYKGAINDVIYMVIRNVNKVLVSILSADGGVIEDGLAIHSNGVWSYQAAVYNPAFPGAKVLVTAEDGQGNEAKLAVPVF
jgi:hypothetical protein